MLGYGVVEGGPVLGCVSSSRHRLEMARAMPASVFASNTNLVWESDNC